MTSASIVIEVIYEKRNLIHIARSYNAFCRNMSQGYRLVKSGQSHEYDYNQQIIVYERFLILVANRFFFRNLF